MSHERTYYSQLGNMDGIMGVSLYLDCRALFLAFVERSFRISCSGRERECGKGEGR